MPLMHARRPKLVPPLIVILLTACAIAAVWLLIAREDSSRADQLRAASATLALSDLQSAPFTAEPRAGHDTSAASLSDIQADRRSISTGLMTRSQSLVAPSLLSSGRSDLAAITPVVMQIYAIAVLRGGLAAQGRRVSMLQGLLTARSSGLATVLAEIEGGDASSAEQARSQAKLGAAAAMVLLVLAFLYFYFRAIITHEVVERLALENKGLLDISRVEARTDALTGLGNRRALASTLAAATADPRARPEQSPGTVRPRWLQALQRLVRSRCRRRPAASARPQTSGRRRARRYIPNGRRRVLHALLLCTRCSHATAP